jgi:hypothetical protein
MRRPCLALLASVLALVACRTERTIAPAGLAAARPLLLTPQRTWRVVEGGELAGLVVRLAPADDRERASKHLYSVRNPLHQELGVVDGLGRAWRHELHAAEPRWVATGTLLEGARAILGAGASAELLELSGPSSE